GTKLILTEIPRHRLRHPCLASLAHAAKSSVDGIGWPFDHAGPETQIGQRGPGQTTAKLGEQLALLKVRQFLQEDRVAHDDLEHSPAHAANSRLIRPRAADRLRPGLFQAEPLLPAAPAAGSHEPA